MEAQLEINSCAGVNYILHSDFNWNDIQKFRVQVWHSIKTITT